jgi:hypothetical protein
MAHVSDLALFDYGAGKADLTTQQTKHLQDRGDSRDGVVPLRCIVEDSGDIGEFRRFLVEQGELPLNIEPPRELHKAQARIGRAVRLEEKEQRRVVKWTACTSSFSIFRNGRSSLMSAPGY